jgi:thiol-disulfide isomerase/thioredoxin
MTPQNQPLKSSLAATRTSTWIVTLLGLIGAAIILVAVMAYIFYSYYNDRAAAPVTVDSTSNNPAPDIRPAAPGSRPAAPTPTLSEDVMQASINLLDGQTTKLADYSGKVLIVDLWATWCGPCREEIPHLVEIAKQYKDRGVEVIGLTNEDPEFDAEMVKQFSAQFNINYPIGWADEGMQQGLMQGRNGIPQTYIIGRDGKVIKRFVGFHRTVISQMKEIIEAAAPAG